MQDVDLEFSTIYGNLGDPIYRIRRYGLRLTTDDLFILVIAGFVAWTVILAGGWGKVWFWSPLLTLDPTLYLAVLFGGAVVLSVMHRVRPEGNITEIVRAGGLPKLYAPGHPDRDRAWRAGIGRAVERAERERAMVTPR